MEAAEFDKLLATETPLLVDFFTTSCEPCRWVLPILDDVNKHFQKNLVIIKIDVEQSKTLQDKYQIKSVPTLILFKKEKILWRIAGFDTATRLIDTIEQQLAAY